jgi:BlaR1 peptidase M56
VIPAYWFSPLPSYLWQVVLHSSIMGMIFYAWAHHVRLPSGRSKRHLLAVLLVLPLLTAAVPGRSGPGFRERVAWLDSGRILAVPLPVGIRLYHVVLLVVVMTVGLTVWQELLPALRRPSAGMANVPERLVLVARGLPGWGRCRIVLSPLESILLATSGWPGHPRLIVSRGAIERLSEDELAIVLRHENAHWQAGRWTWSHTLFLVRLIQCYNPVALWSFREYCLEVEIDCDAEAVAGRDPRLLTRTLLTIYESTDRRDVAARSMLRKRVDVLLDGGRRDDALPVTTIVVASSVLLLVLPWVV